MRQKGFEKLAACYVAVVLALSAGITKADTGSYTPKETFYSEKILTSALADIAQMSEAELRSFIHYLAEYQDERDTTGKHACRAAQTSYEIEFGNKRAIDKLIFARSMLTELPPDIDLKDSTQMMDAAVQHAKVISAIEESARTRFRNLKDLRNK
ncbi:hypothetical protein IYY11_03695 [Methylocystis sp. H62]|uniref:hypothetical protein n=1 Tax=Methylocystis sp. H62 TaxID=2785789 RepID=UPI0018C1D075|nr:hypothetical protein [Methylocystis sp. H62]MBG0792538.1 hypothetical protein [Methylocystis sp. H62]